MINDGWELDSHTINHLDVSRLSGSQLQQRGGRLAPDAPAALPPAGELLLLPVGRYDDQATQAVRDAGYLGATTTDEGLASKDDMFS